MVSPGLIQVLSMHFKNGKALMRVLKKEEVFKRSGYSLLSWNL
jgi:hypothetical protein